MNRRVLLGAVTAAISEVACSTSDPSTEKKAAAALRASCTRPTQFCWSSAEVKVRAQTFALIGLLFNGDIRKEFLADDPNAPSMGGAYTNHPFKRINATVYKQLLAYFKPRVTADAELHLVSEAIRGWSNTALNGLVATYDNPDTCPCYPYDPANPACETLEPLLLG